MKIEHVLEGIVGLLLIIILAIVLIPKEKVTNEPVIIEDTFNQYPLIAWKDTDKKGDIIKIRYRVSNRDTFVEVLDHQGNVVHKQPFQRSPWKDGTPRDFTYSWTLYYTQDYGDEILPGEYEIRVCHKYSSNVDLSIRITI
jgi:hypothetical protein